MEPEISPWLEKFELRSSDSVKGKKQLEERAVGSVDGTQEPATANAERESQKGDPELKRKLLALLKCHRGVEISSAEELGSENSGSKNATELSAEVKIAQESLKSSFSELQAFVKDPLPEALNISDAVGSKLAQKGTNQEQPIQNKGGDVDVSNSNTCGAIVLFQTKDVDHKEKSSVHHSGVQVQRPSLIEENNPALESPNLMEQNRTAHSYERDDSKDNLPAGVQLRRRKRKWSSLEVQKLRTGVEKFGVGNWATIKSCYGNIFENRRAGDLKDKWRNLKRQ